jgi:hypothetical protein
MLRYLGAGLVALVSAVIAIFAFGGDEDDPSLALITTVGFIAVAAGAFCFPISSRCFRSVVLLCLELLFYCMTKLDPNDYFLELHPFPCLLPLVYGGLIAAFFHFVIYLLYLALWPNTARGCVKTPGLGKTSLTFDL